MLSLKSSLLRFENTGKINIKHSWGLLCLLPRLKKFAFWDNTLLSGLLTGYSPIVVAGNYSKKQPVKNA